MAEVIIRAAYDGRRVRPRVDTGPGLTKQAFKDECDINNILRRYIKSRMLTHLAKGVPTYADVSDVGDYRTAIERVRAAEAEFMGLPAKVRAHFDNDPAAFLDWMAVGRGREELEAIGLEVLERRARASRTRDGDAEDPPAE